MKYVVFAEYEDANVSVETNDMEVMFAEAERHRGCPHLCIADGETGEVLMHTGSEPYCSDEFAMMWLGWMMLQHWGEPAPFTNPNYTPAVVVVEDDGDAITFGTPCPVCGKVM